MSKIVGEKGRILSVESDKRAYEILNKNITQNGISNVESENCTASDTNKPNGIIYKGGSQANSIVKGVIRNGNKEFVEYKTIEHLITEHKIKPNFMILTINGAEHKVLEACKDVINELSPLRIIAPGWYDDGNGLVGLRIIKLLKSMRFKVVYTQKLHIFVYKT